MRINRRRGTTSTTTTTSIASKQQHDCINRIVQLFIVATVSIIVCGYYYFVRSAMTSMKSSSSVIAASPSNNVRKSAPKSFRNSFRHGYRKDESVVNEEQAKATVGYAITVTGCPKHDGSRGDFGAGISDGAAVLRHSIHLQSFRSFRGDENGERVSRYDYAMYALVHPDAEECARPALEPLGYEILLRDVPVAVEDIEGEYLRSKVVDNGCCGEKEFVKLHAYTLLQHEVVVHLDLDTLLLRPMDSLYDAIIDGTPSDTSSRTSPPAIDVAFDDPLPDGPIDAFFTRDYNMAHANMKHAGVQGGFLVLRPSLQTYQNFVSIIRKGDFRPNGGWGGLGFGPFYGSMTFQGIMPYYYDHLHPHTGVELNHCIYNNMADNPRDKPTKHDVVDGHCRDGYHRPDKHDQCQDCRSTPFEQIYTTHFTLCQKPWGCLPQDQDRIQERLCRKFHGEWFRVREDLETNIWNRTKLNVHNEQEKVKEVRGGGYQVTHFRGYCKSHGEKGYIRVQLPLVETQ